MDGFLKNFKELEKGSIKIIVKSDAKCVVASSMLVKIFQDRDIGLSLSFLKDLKSNIKFLKNESFSTIFFLGFDYVKEMEKEFKDKKVFIFAEDVEDSDFSLRGDVIENCYLLSKKFIEEDLSYLAFMFNNNIKSKYIVKHKGMMLNCNLKLLDSLSLSFDPYIPGVSGEEEGTKGFLNELKIDNEKNFLNLNEEEKNRLVTAILINMFGSYEDLNEEVYFFDNEEGLLKDVKEFEMLLNFLVEIKKESLGLGVCLKNENDRKIALNLYLNYKKRMIDYLKWFNKNRKTERIIEKKKFVLIKGGDKIKDTDLNKVLGLLSKFNLHEKGTFILGVSYTLGDEVMVGLMICGDVKMDAKEMLKKVLKRDVNGKEDYAWGLIAMDEEKNILRRAMELFEGMIVEERVK